MGACAWWRPESRTVSSGASGYQGRPRSPHPYNRVAVARYAPVALVAALLVATARAFVYTEKLKLTPSPILGTGVDKLFSPVCECETDTATISFRLRNRDRLTVDLIDREGDSVRTLDPGQAHAARTGHDVLERPRRLRARRPRGLLPAAHPPRRGAAHDRDAEPDPRRRDPARRPARLACTARVLARRGRARRQGGRPLPGRRAGERSALRRRGATGTEARPAEDGQDRVVRAAGRRAAACGRVPRRPRRAGRGGQPRRSHVRATGRDPLRGPRDAAGSRRPPAPGLRCSCSATRHAWAGGSAPVPASPGPGR